MTEAVFDVQAKPLAEMYGFHKTIWGDEPCVLVTGRPVTIEGPLPSDCEHVVWDEVESETFYLMARSEYERSRAASQGGR